MPRELSALMIKTTGEAPALKPSIQAFNLSHTSSGTRNILDHIQGRFPGAMAVTSDGGAMLAPADAVTFLDEWRRDIMQDDLIAPGVAGSIDVPAMLQLARDGHTLLLIEE